MEYVAFQEKLESELPPDWDTSKWQVKPRHRASAVILINSTPSTSLSMAPSQPEGPTPSISTTRSSLFDQSSASNIAPLHTIAKWQHVHSSSISSFSSLSPQHKKQVSAMLPNPDDLKDALQSGGGTDLDLARGKRMNVAIFARPSDVLVV